MGIATSDGRRVSAIIMAIIGSFCLAVVLGWIYTVLFEFGLRLIDAVTDLDILGATMMGAVLACPALIAAIVVAIRTGMLYCWITFIGYGLFWFAFLAIIPGTEKALPFGLARICMVICVATVGFTICLILWAGRMTARHQTARRKNGWIEVIGNLK